MNFSYTFSSATSRNRPMRKLSTHLLFFAALVAVSLPLSAEVTRFEITEREPFAGGKAFGSVGAYERIVGRVYFELDPNVLQNRNVIDLELAPRNARGRVELFADLLILAPKDLSNGNGALLYGVNNRGNLNLLRHFNYASGSNNPTDDKHAGDGFLMRHGFTVVWSGWDGELLPGNSRLRLSPPKVTENITGIVRCEIVPNGDTKRTLVNWGNHGSYRPTAEGMKTATLTHRLLAGHPRVPIPREDWTLHVTEIESDSPTQLPRVELEYPAGLNKMHIYELIYEAQDPVVMGTCFTSVRDLVSALMHGAGQSNPLLVDGKSPIRRAHSYGVSQSGRFLRELTYWDFNVDEQGRKVFDGIIPHVSGSGLGSFNHRFAQPTRHAAQHDHHDYPPDRFPFAYGTQTDPLSGLSEGILDRAQHSGSAPLVMHTQSSSEYWNRSGSLVHTDPLGTRDAEIPENVRIYFFGGTQHGPSGFTTNTGDGQTAPNPADYKPFVRALLLALDRWAKDGTAPPPSVYPRIGDGTLVGWTQNATGFPNIPGIRYPHVIQQPSLLDFGSRWQEQRIVDNQPPIPRGDYRVLVPRSDPDGNELGCLSAPEVAVPVATYASWRLRKADGPAANQLYSLSGSYIPFPTTKIDGKTTGDPRQSVEQRYGTLDRYLKQLEAQCRKYELAGYMLPEDTQRTLRIQRERVEPLFKAIATALVPGPNPPEAVFAAMSPDEERAYQRKAMRAIADLTLIPPKLNTNPGPKYDYDQLDYGMTIGIARTPKGRLWAAWVAGEDGPGAFMVAATSDDDGDTWSKPRLVIDSQTPDLPVPRSVIVGNLWTDPLGRLWFFFDQTMNHYDGRAGLWYAICEDPDGGNPTWSKPRRLWHGVCLNKPTITSKGEWLLPAYLLQNEHTRGIGPMKDLFPELDPYRGVNLLVSADQGATWERRACIKFPNPDWHEPMIVERKDGTLWMLVRTRRGLMEAISTDNGHTWSKPAEPRLIKHPNARFHFRRLASGRILLVKHGDRIDHHEGRFKLSAWLSDDEGESWKGGLVLEDRRGVSYPDGFQAPDGTIYGNRSR